MLSRHLNLLLDLWAFTRCHTHPVLQAEFAGLLVGWILPRLWGRYGLGGRWSDTCHGVVEVGTVIWHSGVVDPAQGISSGAIGQIPRGQADLLDK